MAKAKKKSLKEKHAEVIEYVIACIEKDNRTPTYRQIAAEFNMRSTGSVRGVISTLKQKGDIIKDAALSRGVRLNPSKYKVKVSKKK